MNRELTVPGTIESVGSFSSWLTDALVAFGVGSEIRTRIEIAAIEAFTNIARHGYVGRAGNVRCEVDEENARLRIRLEDTAPPFDPVSQESSVRLGNEQHGMGLSIIRDTAEALKYERNGDRNVLVMIFAA